ncbi:MAG: polysaccharide deacetylase family protein [Solirubrobacterales bacterium]
MLFLTGLFALMVLATVADAAPQSQPKSPESTSVGISKLKQEGRALVFQVRTSRQIALKDLEAKPDLTRPKAKFLCFEMTRAGTGLISRICLGGKSPHHTVGLTRTNRGHKVYSKETRSATVKRVNGRKFVLSLEPGSFGLNPSSYSWRAVTADGNCEPGKFGCRSSFPTKRLAKFDLRPVAVVGCTGGNGEFVTRGPRRGKKVALTFDDGPSLYTPDVLRILKKHEVKSTFFVVGQEVQRYPAEARKILAQGHELANHSTHHATLPGDADIRTTNSIIKRTTGFRPCLFRPPGGAVSSGVLSAAAREKVKVVNWNIDTSDWRLPGSGSILNSIKSASAGSIVLMHDGGGPRSQTIAALEAGIKSLQSRGYRLVTVTELLGNRFIYRTK